MKLTVYVHRKPVATLEQLGDFKSVLTYYPDANEDDLVSLTMPVRTQSYEWPEQLPPFFRQNLPEGYLLKQLQAEFGPQIGGDETALLGLIGANMIGRVRVAPNGVPLGDELAPCDVAGLIRNPHAINAFEQLMHAHLRSGVSGVVPKFLDPEQRDARKATVINARHIIKGSTDALPFVALNEHFCMQVAARVTPTAQTEVSADGRVLVVKRFDTDEDGNTCYALEDFCSLLAMRPANKYDPTWERIMVELKNQMRDSVPNIAAARRQIAKSILLSFALRNADYHAKNIALIYTSPYDVMVAPVYDMLTTTPYSRNDQPGLKIAGRLTWRMTKSLPQFLTNYCGIKVAEQKAMVIHISKAVAEVAVAVRQRMQQQPAFAPVGSAMLAAWREGVSMLLDEQHYDAQVIWADNEAFDNLPAAYRPPERQTTIGRSELMAR